MSKKPVFSWKVIVCLRLCLSWIYYNKLLLKRATDKTAEGFAQIHSSLEIIWSACFFDSGRWSCGESSYWLLLCWCHQCVEEAQIWCLWEVLWNSSFESHVSSFKCMQSPVFACILYLMQKQEQVVFLWKPVSAKGEKKSIKILTLSELWVGEKKGPNCEI